MDQPVEKSETSLPSPDQLPRFTRRSFLRRAAVPILGLFLKDLIKPKLTSAAISKPPKEGPVDTEEEIPQEQIKGLSQALARGWIVYNQEDASSKTPELWKNAARNGLELCKFLYQNRQQVSEIAQETFPSINIDPNSNLYYDCMAVRRAKLNSINLSLYLAILATENSDKMRIANAYKGAAVRSVFDPNNYPKDAKDFFTNKGAVWLMQNLILSLRVDYGLYFTAFGEDPVDFDVTAGKLNEPLLHKYNSGNPWWIKRVCSLYREILDFAKNTPGAEYLATNLIQKPNQP